jgi:ribosome modulation factor
MLISKSERTPQYFGYVARSCGQDVNHNPYHKDDRRHSEWLDGFNNGVLQDDNNLVD